MDVSFIIIELMLMALLFVVAKIGVKIVSNKWRLLYAAPSFVTIIMVLLGGFDLYHIGVYAAAFLQIFCLFLGNDSGDEKSVKPKRILAVVSTFMILISLALVLFAPDYKKMSFYEDFTTAFNTMKEHYVLTEEKGIEWDELYAKYDPLFKEVDKSQDYVENYKLWLQFTGEFYDGHVGYEPGDEGLWRNAFCRLYGNDYGLCLARLSTGEYVAVNVEGYDNSYSVLNDEHDEFGYYSVKEKFLSKSAEQDRLTLKNAGIKNGTVITKWNGRPVEEYFEDIKYYIEQYPVRENEEFYLPMYVAGIGNGMEYGETYVPGETLKSKSGATISENPTVDITYINEKGEEKEVTAPSLGIYVMRMKNTMNKIDNGVNITNLDWQKVNDDTYLIRISQMAYDQETYSGSDYTKMTDELREDILDLKSKGVKNMIIDIRSNSGGSPYFVEGIAQLLAPKGEHLTYYNAEINEKTATYERGVDGKYKMGVPSGYEGEDLWHDGQIILLVNAITVSAGDDMTYMLGEFPNVKVMGLTRSNSSCQAVTGVSLENGDISFSAVPNLLPNGEIAIDTYTDHVGRTPFDEKIPFTTELITSIFDKGEDYILDYAANSF